MKPKPSLPFAVTSVDADSLDDGEVINFAEIGNVHVMQWKPGPSYRTELLVDPDCGDDFHLTLNLEHFTDFTRFQVGAFEAMSQKDCIRKLQRLLKVVRALPAVGIPSPLIAPLLLKETAAQDPT